MRHFKKFLRHFGKGNLFLCKFLSKSFSYLKFTHMVLRINFCTIKY